MFTGRSLLPLNNKWHLLGFIFVSLSLNQLKSGIKISSIVFAWSMFSFIVYGTMNLRSMQKQFNQASELKTIGSTLTDL